MLVNVPLSFGVNFQLMIDLILLFFPASLLAFFGFFFEMCLRNDMERERQKNHHHQHHHHPKTQPNSKHK